MARLPQAMTLSKRQPSTKALSRSGPETSWRLPRTSVQATARNAVNQKMSQM